MNNFAMKLLNRFLPSCKEVSHLTSQAMDESLPWGKQMQLRIHLKMCIWCRRNDEQLKLMKKLGHDKSSSIIDDTKLSPDVKERMNQFLIKNDDQS